MGLDSMQWESADSEFSTLKNKQSLFGKHMGPALNLLQSLNKTTHDNAQKQKLCVASSVNPHFFHRIENSIH